MTPRGEDRYNERGVPSDRNTMLIQRSSAEVSEIQKEVNKHKKYQSAHSLDKNYDPEAMKKSLQVAMHIQLQNMILRISDKEKQYVDQERQYSEMQQQLSTIENKTIKIVERLKNENNTHWTLQTQVNFLLQAQFGRSPAQKTL